MIKEQRLIDANALKEKAEPEEVTGEGIVYVQDIDEAPTVDAVEVVHAEWLDIRFDSMWRSMLATCSHCEVRGEVRVKANECGFAVPDSDYCPSCGAKMDGGINK